MATSFDRPVAFDEISFSGDELSSDQIWKPPIAAEPSFPRRSGLDEEWYTAELSDSTAGVFAEIGRSINLSVAADPGTMLCNTPHTNTRSLRIDVCFISKWTVQHSE